MFKKTDKFFDFAAIKQNIKLAEAEEKSFMTKRERILKKKLIDLLKDDGRGHHHARYAACLSLFDVNIVPLKKQPSTAAISFDEGIIYVNEGFLQDPSTFYQLNVIMRHELCHNLLMHQIRMVKHLSEIPESRLRMSMSIHELCNIIEDFEISNKKYSKEDKEVVRNTWLNGQLISGLVTEDHRRSWADLSLEQMYDAFEKEIADSNYSGHLSNTSSGNLSHAAAKLASYKDITTASEFDEINELKSAITGGKKDVKIPAEWQEIFDGLQWIIDDPNNAYDEKAIVDMLEQIGKSKPIGKVDIVSPVTGELLTTVYTPEEKQIAAEILKIIGGNTAYQQDYNIWYKEVERILGNGTYTKDEIQDILDSLN